MINLNGGDAGSAYEVRYHINITSSGMILEKRELAIYPPWDFEHPDQVLNFN